MTLEELRKEYCNLKGWRYIQFDDHTELQEYTLWVETKALNIGAVGQSLANSCKRCGVEMNDNRELCYECYYD